MQNKMTYITRAAVQEIFSRATAKIALHLADKLGFMPKTQHEAVKAENAQLHKLAHTVHVTGLPNGRILEEELQSEYRRAIRSKHPFLLVAIDCDHFKRINEDYGHLTGDNALRHVGKTIQSGLRKSDRVMHKSGDEFFIIAPIEVPENYKGHERDAYIAKAAWEIMTKVREAVATSTFKIDKITRAERRIEETDAKVTISLGGVIFDGFYNAKLRPTDEDINLECAGLISRADTFLKKSKSPDGNKVHGNVASLCWFHVSDPPDTRHKVAWELIKNYVMPDPFSVPIPDTAGMVSDTPLIPLVSCEQSLPLYPERWWPRAACQDPPAA